LWKNCSVWRRAEEIPRASSSSAAETQETLEDYHPPGLPQVEAETIVGVESAESVEVLPRVVEEDGSEHYYKNKCLPLLFPWRQIATTKLSRHPGTLLPPPSLSSSLFSSLCKRTVLTTMTDKPDLCFECQWVL
jgi:hypothetical protein